MIRDRLPDLIRLARLDPDGYDALEVHEEIPMPPDLQVALQRVEKILKFIREIESILRDLKIQHQNVLESSSLLNTNKLRSKISLLSNRFSALSRKTENILRRIELSDQEKIRYLYKKGGEEDRSGKKDFTVKWEQTSSSVKVTWPVDSISASVYVPAEVRMKKMLHDVLSKRLTDLVEEFYTEQKHYSDLSQKKIERQLSIIGRTMKQEDIDRVMDENLPLLQQGIHDDKQVSKEMRMQLKEMAHYEKEIYQLERNIVQLHNTFLVVSKFVHEQGVMVDRIERHVIMASDYVATGAQQLKKAGKLQNKYRKKKLILAIVIIVILGVVAAIIAISIVSKKNDVTVHANSHSKQPPS